MIIVDFIVYDSNNKLKTTFSRKCEIVPRLDENICLHFEDKTIVYQVLAISHSWHERIIPKEHIYMGNILVDLMEINVIVDEQIDKESIKEIVPLVLDKNLN